MTVLDTHVAVWALTDPDRLSEVARQAIRNGLAAGEQVCCASVSLYEIGNSVRRGRLSLNTSAAKFLAAVQSKFPIIPLVPEIAIIAAQLPAAIHGDPMDRIIAATAIANDCILITADHKIQQSGVCNTLW